MWTLYKIIFQCCQPWPSCWSLQLWCLGGCPWPHSAGWCHASRRHGLWPQWRACVLHGVFDGARWIGVAKGRFRILVFINIKSGVVSIAFVNFIYVYWFILKMRRGGITLFISKLCSFLFVIFLVISWVSMNYMNVIIVGF